MPDEHCKCCLQRIADECTQNRVKRKDFIEWEHLPKRLWPILEQLGLIYNIYDKEKTTPDVKIGVRWELLIAFVMLLHILASLWPTTWIQALQGIVFRNERSSPFTKQEM